MKRVTCIVLILLLLSTGFGYSQNLQDTASYLDKQQIDEWGILALYSYGQNVNHKQLEGVDESNVTTDYEAFIMGAIPQGLDVSEYAQKIIKSQRADGKFADYIDGGGSDLVNAHIWGIISLYAANEESYNKENALKWLKNNQNEDGGFSVYTGDGYSDIDMTGMGIVALNILGLNYDSTEVQNAIDFIDDNLSKKESCESYAWCILARVKLGLDVDKSMLNNLTKYRLDDGSYKHLESIKKSNYMATWHGLLAQIDYNNRTSIFDNLHNALRFVDLGKTDYAYNEIMILVNKGIISGYSDNTFKPNALVKRSEFSKFLVYGLGLQNKISKETNQFNDLKGHWSNKIVNVAVKEQLIKGVNSNQFAPESKITGAEVATMLVRAKGLEEKAKTIKGDNWYDGYVQVAQESGLLYTNFNPKKHATRAQCAEAVCQLIDN